MSTIHVSISQNDNLMISEAFFLKILSLNSKIIRSERLSKSWLVYGVDTEGVVPPLLQAQGQE